MFRTAGSWWRHALVMALGLGISPISVASAQNFANVRKQAAKAVQQAGNNTSRAMTTSNRRQFERDIEFDNHVQTRLMPTPQPDRRAEALNLAAGIVGLVQTAVANRPQPEYVPENVQFVPQTVQYQPQYVPQTVQYVPQTIQAAVPQEPVTASPPPVLTPAVETTVLIKNLTEKPQNYAVRRAGSQWGKYTLAAGAEHKFVIPAEELEVHYLTGVGSEPATISVPGDHIYAFAVDQGKVGLFLADPE